MLWCCCSPVLLLRDVTFPIVDVVIDTWRVLLLLLLPFPCSIVVVDVDILIPCYVLLHLMLSTFTCWHLLGIYDVIGGPYLLMLLPWYPRTPIIVVVIPIPDVLIIIIGIWWSIHTTPILLMSNVVVTHLFPGKLLIPRWVTSICCSPFCCWRYCCCWRCCCYQFVGGGMTDSWWWFPIHRCDVYR